MIDVIVYDVVAVAGAITKIANGRTVVKLKYWLELQTQMMQFDVLFDGETEFVKLDQWFEYEY